ncbi:MAG TPA: hypothetical protein PK264_13700 [Hyphomicrobiaceae bacterium]|nr:hypothetical protein [Hyphomicrobiaceae bacterium]
MSNKTPYEQLRDGELPGMVSWYDPRVLARIGVRTIVSSVFGQYADQRLLQAATDQSTVTRLIERYDYSDPSSSDPERRLTTDENGAIWIDYVADTGDGFESTYTMAYLLAKPTLDMGEVGTLKAGEILVMGGDQCYPQATREEYKKRLQVPFGWAYNVSEPQRKLFAIPGNHDWYDGLTAFDSLFCSARDRLSSGRGNVIGGWQCQQHRSYWALKLPHKWWIWGTDIQFSSYLDNAQVNYFQKIAEEMGPDDKLILCIAEPSWMIADLEGGDEEQNFFKITSIARQRGVRICAVVAGDWHHYNRYYQPDLDVHFFTAGGGSFLHPTHTLKNEIKITWPERVQWVEQSPQPTVAGPSGDWSPAEYSARLKRPDGPVGSVREAVREALRPGSPRTATAPRQRDTKCYPDKSTSWWLSLRNLFFPLYNIPFGIGIGLIYWLITWQFHTVVRAHDISSGEIDHISFATIPAQLAWMPVYILQATLSIGFVAMVFGLAFVLLSYVQVHERRGIRAGLFRTFVGGGHFLAHMIAAFALFLTFTAFNNWLAPHAARGASAMLSADWMPTIVRPVVQKTLEPISTYRTETRTRIAAEEGRSRSAPSSVSSVPPPPGAALPPLQPITATQTSVDPKAARELIGLLYPFQMVLLGGLLGGFIWGLYWVITGVLWRMHTEDAFGALRIADYKNFLRLKLEPDQVTIYPLGVDRIVRASGWAEPAKDKAPLPNNPALVPADGKQPAVRLIEAPIVIRASQQGPTS